jgi:predicted AlkP superfamily phosphohydrolase/phosphomutase
MLLFAIDGLEWRVMKPLLAAGKLPVMSGLMSRGAFGYLESMDPTFSAVIWTSIATAKTPDKHGIKHFIFETDRGEYRYYTSGHRETKAFWNILSDYGLSVNCVGWWITYPAEPINGTMVSQTNTTSVLRDPQRALWKGSLFKGVEDQVYPPDYQNHVMDLLEKSDASINALTDEIFGERPHPPTAFGELMWDQAIWSLRGDAVYIDVAKDLLRTGDPFDLTAVYIGGPDVTGHRFWHYAYPDEFRHPPPQSQIENYGNVIADYYVYVDRSIGEIIDAAPENTTVMIVSDHGMHGFNRDRVFNPKDPPQYTNSGHHLDAPPGVFIAAGTQIRGTGGSFRDGGAAADIDLTKLKTVGSVLDVVPTIFAMKGIPQGRDFDGKPLVTALSDDWLSSGRVEHVATHDTKEWLQARGDRIRRAVDESERLEQLRSLGYIR